MSGDALPGHGFDGYLGLPMSAPRFDLGLRREDKSRWERRAPITPLHVRELVRDLGRSVVVQPSSWRIFPDEAYREAGAMVAEELSGARVILGVKEIPVDRLVPGRPHLFFAHVVKGQPANMPLLARLLSERCTLIDYEPIVDARGRRLIFFGRHAGYAGMIDALAILGRRLAARGVDTAFSQVRLAHEYPDLAAALAALGGPVSERIRERGVQAELHPLVVGFTGGGNVTQGAQQVLGQLPLVEISPGELPTLASRELSRQVVYAVNFRREDRAEFSRHLPFLTVLVNGIYWTPGDPVLVTRTDLVALLGASARPKLEVIADVSCDVDGSIEATVRATTPDEPAYVYDPTTGAERPGVEGPGPAVLAVDNLPAELPRDASEHFGDSLFPFLADLTVADYSVPFEHLELPSSLLDATVTHQGALTPRYRYLERFLRADRP